MSAVDRIVAVEYSREYGGPEEGDWWYDLTTPLASRRARGKKRNRRFAREMRRRFAHLDDGRPLSSVLSTGRVNVITVSRAYADEYLNDQRPQSRPHYE